MRNVLKLSASLFILANLFGCNSYTPKNHATGITSAHAAQNPDYASVNEFVLKPYCLSCHSSAMAAGGVSLDNYANVMRFIARVQDTVINKQSMPPGQPIQTELQQLLATWIDDGEPEVTQDTATGAGQGDVQPADAARSLTTRLK